MSLKSLLTPPTIVDVSKWRCKIVDSVVDKVEAKKYGIQSCVKSADLEKAKLWVLNSGCVDICPPPELPEQEKKECLCIIKKPSIITEL